MPHKKHIAVIGGGPAGLMAAEVLATAGVGVTVYDRKPSPGRKFLMAGRGGLNLTHSEDKAEFMARYGAAAPRLAAAIDDFPPSALRVWCEGLGQKTFVGSSGRVFPESFKASPLLRAWIARLESLGVQFALNRDWQGWNDDGALVFAQGDAAQADAVVLALGGASWPRLGSDGGWVEILKAQGVPVTMLRPANCGFVVEWSDIFRDKFAGQPLKPVVASCAGQSVEGEMMMARNGIEGGAIYALSAVLREEIAAQGSAVLTLDLRPGLSVEALAKRLGTPRGRDSFVNYLRKIAGLSPVAIGLLMELPERKEIAVYRPEKLAALIKALPLRLTAPFPIERAISTAGGIALAAVDKNFMLKNKPGVFVAGEMLDWEAPTGGYLLQATFSTAVRAARGVLAWTGQA